MQQFEGHDQAIALAIDLWQQATGYEIPPGLFLRYSNTLAELEPKKIIEAMNRAIRGAWIDGHGNWPTGRDLWRLAGGHPAERLGKARAMVRDQANELLADGGPMHKRLRFGAQHEDLLQPYTHLIQGLPGIKELIEIDTGGETDRGRNPWRQTAREIRGLIDFEQAAQSLALKWDEQAHMIADHSPKARKMEFLT